MNQEYMGGDDFMGPGVSSGAAAHGSSNENSIDISNHSVTMTIMEPSDSVVLRGHNCTIEIGAGNTIKVFVQSALASLSTIRVVSGSDC